MPEQIQLPENWPAHWRLGDESLHLAIMPEGTCRAIIVKGGIIAWIVADGPKWRFQPSYFTQYWDVNGKEYATLSDALAAAATGEVAADRRITEFLSQFPDKPARRRPGLEW